MSNEYYGAMTMDDIPEKELRKLAKTLEARSAAGGQLSTSTIEPVATQGRLMQTMSGQRARDVGVQNYRKVSERNELAKTMARIAGGTSGSPFNKLTSTERKDAVNLTQNWKKEALMHETWTPEKQMQLYGGMAQGLSNAGVPMPQGVDDSLIWWKEYANWENAIRKDLFGSALTGYEIKAWDKANVNAKMAPELVAKNFQVRGAIMRKHAADRAIVMQGFGWPTEVLVDMFNGIIPQEEFRDLRGFADRSKQQYMLSLMSDEELQRAYAE